MIKKVFKFLNDVIGLPFYIFIKSIKGATFGLKKSIKGFIVSAKWSAKQFIKFIKNIPGMLKILGKWFIDAIKESIAQIFTLLGFFIAWFTLTGTAQDIVGISIVVSTIIWLVTIRLRD